MKGGHFYSIFDTLRIFLTLFSNRKSSGNGERKLVESTKVKLDTQHNRNEEELFYIRMR